MKKLLLLPFVSLPLSLFAQGEATAERVIVTGSYAGNATASEYRLAPVTVSQGIHVIYLISPAK